MTRQHSWLFGFLLLTLIGLGGKKTFAQAHNSGAAIPRCEVLPLPDNQVSLRIDGVEITRWHFDPGVQRPFLYPFNGPSGSSLTRMGHPGAENHDHHRSIWFAHHVVSGVDFWTNQTAARVRQKHWYAYNDGDDEAVMAVALGWYDGDGRELMQQDLVVALMPVGEDGYGLEIHSTFQPPTDEVMELGKTNFGFLAVRVAKSLSEHFGGGRLTNSHGDVGEPAIFGKPAEWVDYSGTSASGTGSQRQAVEEGLTYFDHPDNSGFPTHWHVRADGWMGAAVNLQAPLMISRTEPLSLRYYLHAHPGAYDEGRARNVRDAFHARPGFTIAKATQSHEQYSVARKPIEQGISQWLRPFWRGDTVEGESVLFIRDAATGEARASVLFPIEELLSVGNSAGDTTYEPGRDYRWQPGSREIVLPVGSRIVSRTADELRRPSGTQQYRLTHRDGNGEILFGAKLEYHAMQTCVTYKHAPAAWQGPDPTFRVAALPRTIQRLREQQPLAIVLLGDSISTGCNASGWAEGPPLQPAYPELLRRQLEASYSTSVNLTNLSVGGMATPWGVTMVEQVVQHEPDLVLLAFGMNDAAGRSAEEYLANTQAMIDKIREQRPAVEFILIATMLGNRDWTALNHDIFPLYRDALASLTGEGIALADMTGIWTELLKLKQDWDLTGNGVNHPNDFGHRVYAQVVSALLVPDSP